MSRFVEERLVSEEEGRRIANRNRLGLVTSAVSVVVLVALYALIHWVS